MSDWTQKSIVDCAEILDNLRIPVNGETRADNLGSTPYYGANGLQGYIEGHIFDEPLILIAEDGGYFDEFATRSIAYRISGKSWVNNHAHILRPKQELDFDFLFYSLEHKNILPFIKGGTRAKLNQAELREIKIALPPTKKIQQKIASILISIDTTIEKTDSLIAKYQKIKAGLMYDLFTRGVTADGKLRPPREQAPELYQETPVGWIPKEWQIVRMVDLAEDRKGATTIGPFGSDLVATDYRLEGVPVVFVRDVKESGFEWNSETYVSGMKALQLKAHSVKTGEVLVTKMGLPPCISCLFPEWMPNGVITADMIRLSPDNKKVDGHWLTAAINHDRVKRQVAGITAGVTRPKVTLADFRGIKIAKPELDEQKLISDKLRVAQNNINAELAQVDKLQSQKLGLMQDLLTGKVPVKIDESGQEFA